MNSQKGLSPWTFLWFILMLFSLFIMFMYVHDYYGTRNQLDAVIEYTKLRNKMTVFRHQIDKQNEEWDRVQKELARGVAVVTAYRFFGKKDNDNDITLLKFKYMRMQERLEELKAQIPIELRGE